MFSIIAHDLRSPFHPLLGLSEMMNTEIDTLSREEIRKLCAEFNKLLRNQYNLLENLLNWSRMQAGKIEFRPIKLDLGLLTDTVFQLLLASAVKKSITLVNRISAPVILMADQTMLQSVIQNLVSNAIKFTDAGGQITLSARLLNNFYEISVSDSGVGISKENLRKIFDIETTFTSNGTANERGTGLGLLICKEMVEKHGGTIRVESEVGKGSTFIFTIPI
jgi:signal transduction histidine kinase